VRDHLGVEAIASGVRDRAGHTPVQVVSEAPPRTPGPAPRLFHCPQFLSTEIRPVRKDSHD
jgi:hypothetical protein